MDDGIAFLSATELAKRLRAREISSRELLDLFLDRVGRLDPAINAVVTLDAEGARRAAGIADDAAMRGEWMGPLHGLPVTIKDAIEVGGMRSTGGATELRDHVPAGDAPVVASLRRAGAVVFGKTNVPRWSGDLQVYNDVFGRTNNPWDVSRTTGGSSGGAAAAVASGFTAFEIGTDIGGSVRIPSHCCGVFGLKPSFGVIPQRGYLDHVGGGRTDADINVFGPIARSAEDLDLLLGVTAGPPPEQALAWRLELPPPRRTALAGVRIGVWFDEPDFPVEAGVRDRLAAAASALSDAGAVVDEAHPAVSFAEQVHVFSKMVSAATSVSKPDYQRDDSGGTHRAWLAAEEQRAGMRAVWAEWFEGYDVLLCPVMPVAAFPHNTEGTLADRKLLIDAEEHPYLAAVAWTGLIGITGLPSAVPPIGRTPQGLPVGVQVVTPYLRDREAIWMAGALARLCGGYVPPPLCV